jgi:hypothetical protein
MQQPNFTPQEKKYKIAINIFITRQQMERDNNVLNRIVAGIPHIYYALQFFMSTILICYV